MVRVLLQAISDTLYPSHLKAHRSHIGLEMTHAALLNVNSVFYTILAPESLRARGVLNLLPHRESNPLRSGQQDTQWRRAIRSVFRRQRNSLLGGTGWDPDSAIASVYQRDNNLIGYTGLTKEWRRDNRERTGTLIRKVEH